MTALSQPWAFAALPSRRPKSYEGNSRLLKDAIGSEEDTSFSSPSGVVLNINFLPEYREQTDSTYLPAIVRIMDEEGNKLKEFFFRDSKHPSLLMRTLTILDENIELKKGNGFHLKLTGSEREAALNRAFFGLLSPSHQM